ncbi:MAG: hypothetical protein SWI22_14875 [Pseudomonadota bacterium]|nr:hypothetical protein [Pseudomonadota bacterium]
MRVLTLSAAVLALFAASAAQAGDPRGGGHRPPPAPCCGGGHGGGGHGGGGHGGGSHNVNINVNASARASASAYASAGSYINARTYDVGGVRGRGYGGGTVYVGGGYGGEAGGYGYAGGPVYYDIDRRVTACASAPFGYVVTGFGRDGRRPPTCGGGYYEASYEDRGGRYGYSERHESYEERSYESYESYEESGAYETGEAFVGAAGGYDRDEAWAARQYDRGYMDGRRDCDCGPDGRDGEPYFAPPPPAREPAFDTSRPYEPAPPRHNYRQEPGERG